MKGFAGITLVFVLIGLAGACLVLVGTSRYGAGISSDSVTYICVARNLLTGRGFVGYDGQPYVFGPPLYPSVLAFCGLYGPDPLRVSRYVNALCFGAVVFISGMWLHRHAGFRPLAFAGAAAVLASPVLLKVFMYAWTEGLFILLTVCALFTMGRWLAGGRIGAVVLTASGAALACLARWIGVTVVLTGMAVLLFRRDCGWRRRLGRAVLFGSASVLPVAAWGMRNWLLHGTVAGRRGQSAYGMVQNLRFVADVVWGWCFPPGMPAVLSLLTGVLILGAAVALVWCWLFDATGRVRLVPAVPLIVFVFIYVAWLVAVSTFVAIDRINDRLCSPIYIPLVLSAVFGLDCACGFFSRRSAAAVAYGVLALAGAGLVYPCWRSVDVVSDAVRSGAGGFASDLWERSALIEWLREHPLRGRIYSNVPDGLYILAGIPSRLSPRKHLYNSPSAVVDDLKRFSESLSSDEPVYLVWFDRMQRRYLYAPDELGRLFEMRKVAAVNDGVIYRIR